MGGDITVGMSHDFKKNWFQIHVTNCCSHKLWIREPKNTNSVDPAMKSIDNVITF